MTTGTAEAAFTGRPRALRMLVASAGWAGCFLLLGVALRGSPPLWVATWRALLAGTSLLAVSAGHRLLGRRRSGSGRDVRVTVAVPWPLVGVMALANVSVGLGAMATAAGGTSTGAATVLANAQPLLVILPAWMLYGERPWRWTLPALAVGALGLVLTADPTASLAGSAAALLASVGLAVSTLLARRIGTADLLTVGGWQYVVGGLLLAVTALVVEGHPVVPLRPGPVAALLVLSVFGTAVPLVIWLGEARRCAVTPLAAWTLLVPVLGVALGVVAAGERPGPVALLGYVLVLVSTVVVLVGETRTTAADRVRH
ncbi:DMT family transporter [Kineosporia sp. R_H_3]|uniref:DMT family transporter n=1 Tax=Kineosporia sp. R_H_3 TaxID=1961848 RepID=UPI0013046455|nr:DMT family transporter [Kineosporia sp. R_H_3]